MLVAVTSPERELNPAADEERRLDPELDARFEEVAPQTSPPPGELDATRWNAAAAVRSAAHGSLPPELVRESVRRLGGIAAVASAVFSVYLVYLIFVVDRSLEPWRSAATTMQGALTAALVLSVAVFGTTRVRKLRPEYALDLGYVYLFLVCFLLGLLRHSHPWPVGEALRQWSLVTVPIFAFASLIPATPRKAGGVAVAAGLMDPLAFYMLRAKDLHLDPSEVAMLLATPLLGAVMAVTASRVIHQLSEGIAKARQVGSYRLVERLGVGGMAEVWRGQHRMLARAAAVKLIRPEVLQNHGPHDAERLVRLFAREARTTASLESPHTIQLYDFGITREGAFYYVMELLNGVDLQSLVERFGRQPPERVAYLLRQACHSLEEAHARAFVHRDVKPANIFTCHFGPDYDFVKVLDFGLVLDRHPTQAELEDERQFVGTPSVMAPEMVRFQAPVDARADLYALGCVGYWLLTGKRVFEAETRPDMLVMHAHQKPVLPSKRVGNPLHEGLERVIMDCLEKNPNKRPQSARELAERLEALAFEYPWGRERARLWWRKNQVEPALEPTDPATPQLAPIERAPV
jgi:serine/threonine-protein kinase